VINSGPDCASPHHSEVTVKPATPVMNTFLVP
jgi:hypothetical protein